MAVIMGIAWGGSNGQWLSRDNVTGADVRSSHTIMCRVKWQTTATGTKHYPAVYTTSAGTSGSFVGRESTDGAGNATRTRGGRFSTGGTFNTVNHTGSYGDTTTWRHLAMVYNSATQIAEYYVDGVSIGTVASTTGFVASDTAGVLGMIAIAKIADYAAYNRALTAGEVLQMAQARALSVTSNCLGFYRMDTNSTGGTGSGSAADTSGSSNTLTVATGGTGSPALSYSTADNPPQPDYLLASTGSAATSGSAAVNRVLALGSCTGATSTTGTVAMSKSQAIVPTGATSTTGTAALQNSTVLATSPASGFGESWFAADSLRTVVSTDYFQSGTVSFDMSQPWTVSGWFKPAVNYASSYLMIGSATHGDIQLGLISGSGVQNHWFAKSGTGFWSNQPSTNSAYHHLAMTHSAGTITYYVDGSSIGTTSTSLSGQSANYVLIRQQESYFGYPLNRYASVDIGQIKIWNGVALNGTQITTEMNGAVPVTSLANLWAWYKLDRTVGLLDSGPNSYHLTNGQPYRAGAVAPSGINYTYITASGSSSTAGSAQVTRLFNFASSGATSTAGTAATSATAPLAPTANTTTQGSAAISAAASIAAASSTQTLGTATLVSSAALVPTGVTSTAGTATVAASASVAATGEAQTTGSATGAWTFVQTATGQSQTTGSTITAGTLPCNGATQTTGVASFDAVSFPVIPTGETQGTGSAAVGIEYALVANGNSLTAGTAAMTASALLACVGQTTTSGSATFFVPPTPGGGGSGDPSGSRRSWAIESARRKVRSL